LGGTLTQVGADVTIAIARAGKNMLGASGGVCRFTPSCTHYAREAARRHRFFRAMALVAWRFIRCNPLFGGGYDPVPEPGKAQRP